MEKFNSFTNTREKTFAYYKGSRESWRSNIDNVYHRRFLSDFHFLQQWIQTLFEINIQLQAIKKSIPIFFLQKVLLSLIWYRFVARIEKCYNIDKVWFSWLKDSSRVSIHMFRLKYKFLIILRICFTQNVENSLVLNLFSYKSKFDPVTWSFFFMNLIWKTTTNLIQNKLIVFPTETWLLEYVCAEKTLWIN